MASIQTWKLKPAGTPIIGINPDKELAIDLTYSNKPGRPISLGLQELRQIADDAASSRIASMMRRYADNEADRAAERFRDYRVRLSARFMAKFGPYVGRDQGRVDEDGEPQVRGGFVLLETTPQADDNWIELHTSDNGRLVSQKSDQVGGSDTNTMKRFKVVAGSLDKYDAFLIAKQPLDKAEELDIDKFLETASVAQALQNMRISNLQMRLYLTTAGQTPSEADFDEGARAFELDMHHTDIRDMENQLDTTVDVLWRTLQFGGELWQDCFEKRRELTPDEIDGKLLGPVDIAPTVFDDLKRAMKNKMNPETHAILLPTSETAPVLFDEPIIDFSDTRNGWALGNEPTLSLDVFHHTINMLDTIQSDFLDYRTFVDDSTFKLEDVDIPIMKGGVPVGRSFEELFVDSFNGFHYSNSRAIGRTVFAVAMGQAYDKIKAIWDNQAVRDRDAFEQKYSYPMYEPWDDRDYDKAKAVATFFRLLVDGAPQELGAATKPLAIRTPVRVRGRAAPSSALTRCAVQKRASKTIDFIRVEGNVIRTLQTKLGATTSRPMACCLASRFQDGVPRTCLQIIEQSGNSQSIAIALAQMMITMNVYDKVRSDAGSKQRYATSLAVTANSIGDLAYDILFRIRLP